MTENTFSFNIARLNALPLPPTGKRASYNDERVPGLQIRLTASGVKTFSVFHRMRGNDNKPYRYTIGRFPDISIENARNTARQVLAEFATGTNLAEEKKNAATLRAQKQTLGIDAWNVYLSEHKDRWSESHYNDHITVSNEGGKLRTRGKRPGESDRTLPGILRDILLLPLANIKPDVVIKLIKKEAQKRPTHTRNAFGLLRAFLNWCQDDPRYTNIVDSETVTSRAIKRVMPPKKAKHDCLQKEQLGLWFKHVRAIENPTVSCFLQTLLLTGARFNEIATMQWANIDFKWKTALIHDKDSDERTIPLTPYVHHLLSKLQELNDTRSPPSEWVFYSSLSESGHIEDPGKAHEKALANAGIPHLTFHGLRRSFKTLSEWVEVSAGILAQIMGHKPSAIAEKHYTVRPIDLLRQWHERIEAWILQQAGLLATPKRRAMHKPIKQLSTSKKPARK